MPKSFVEMSSGEAGSPIIGRLSWGFVWGGISGAMIGVGVSMTIGLFYSSATAWIFTLIATLCLLGAVFGQIMAALLADDGVFTGNASGVHNASYKAEPMTDLCEHKALQEHVKIIPNQEVMAKINSMRASSASLAPYPDSIVFELIVSAARKTRAGEGQAGMEQKALS